MSNLSPINDINLKIFDEICEERFKGIDLNVLLVTIIDNVPSDALPHLAEQYHVTGNEGWLQCRNDDEKRDLIKRAIEVHRYKGTKYALRKIFDMFGIEGKINEWFETGGEPFTFSVDLDFVSKGLDYELIAKLEDLINEYKNVRSHLLSMKISMTFIICILNPDIMREQQLTFILQRVIRWMTYLHFYHQLEQFISLVM